MRRLAHVCLKVRDLARTTAFYQDALGLEPRFTFERGGRRIGAYFAAGGESFIEVFEEPGVEVRNTGITHFCFETGELDGLVARLERAGVPHGEKVMGADGSWQLWLQDPDGNAIEVQQYTAESSQRRGGVVTLGG